MAWRHTPNRSAPHPPPYRTPASTRLTVIIATIVLLVLLLLSRWYVRGF
jgi:hypothetical protein